MPDLNDTHEFLLATARSFGAEVTSPWFNFQLGLMMAGGGTAFAIGAAIRSRIDMTSLAMGWPAPLGVFARIMIGSLAPARLARAKDLPRVVMLSSTWPSRSYLLAVSA